MMKCPFNFFLLLFGFLISSSFVRHLPGENTNEILQFAKSFLPEDPVIIEAGSYNGEDSFRIAQFWPKGKLFSFEPVPELFQQVLKKSDLCPNMACFQKALSDQNGFATLYLSEWNGKLAGSSSLLAPKEHLICDPSVTFSSVLEVETVLSIVGRKSKE